MAEHSRTDPMASKYKRKEAQEPPKEVKADSGVLTVSEHAKLSDKEKQTFRDKNGTVKSDPI